MSDDTIPTGPPTGDQQAHDGHATVSVAEAARRLGLSTDAVRSRLRRGTLAGVKDGDTWAVVLPDDGPRQDATGTTDRRQDDDRQETGQETGPPTGNATGTTTVDIAPLVQLVDDLTRRNADLSAAAALWQSRAAYLEERLQQLEAGPIAPPQAPGSPERDEVPAHGSSVASPDEVPQGGEERSVAHDPGGWLSRLRRWIAGS